MKKISAVMGMCATLFTFKDLSAQTRSLKQKIEQYIAAKPAVIGVAVAGMEDRDTTIVNGSIHYPMQSTYKFHLALAILDQVDKGRFTYEQKITVKKEDLVPKTWSPLRDAYPEGTTISLKELLAYSVTRSDNNACDILFRLLGGPKEVNRYIHSTGIKDIQISATEEDANKSWDVQYTNWSTPLAMVQLLKKFHEKGLLSPKSHSLLWDMMINSIKTDRIKGHLPEGTVVAHKTGLSGTNARHVTAATNDIGIVELPDGKHFSIAVLVSESTQSDSLNAATIADITRIAWNYYIAKSLALLRQHFDYIGSIDSLITLADKTKKPFNGTILVSQNGRRLYSKVIGFADMERKSSIVPSSQYFIGSISKQFTAVLVLQQIEKGAIRLNATIGTYLPAIQQAWKDSVTIHQLLTHTHGIVALDQPLASRPGKVFQFSQLGFDLLAQILENATHKSFMALSLELFERCNMRGTFHPGLGKHKNLVKGYVEQPNGQLIAQANPLKQPVAGEGFVSTAADLLTWNTLLHGGKLFADTTLYQKMIAGYAVRDHPVFGMVDYGYGIVSSDKDDIFQLGQTGHVPGYLTMDLYYPASKTNIIILSNIARDTANQKSMFAFDTQVLNLIKQSDLIVR